jgi:hypothetical protein
MNVTAVHLVNIHAQSEGWQIFDCYGSDNGRWQLCRIDSPSEWSRERGVSVTPLRTDSQAWRIVMRGESMAARMAQEFMSEHNPTEWALMHRYCTA